MTADSIISLCGAIVTVAGALFTLSQAKSAKNYSDQIKVDVEKVSLMRVTESLYRCQEEIRKLPRDRASAPRGFKINESLERIWPHFDHVLSSHVLSGDNNQLRASILSAQSILKDYESNKPGAGVDPFTAQVVIQGALSEINSKVFRLDGK